MYKLDKRHLVTYQKKIYISLSIVKFQICLLDQLISYQSWPKDQYFFCIDYVYKWLKLCFELNVHVVLSTSKDLIKDLIFLLIFPEELDEQGGPLENYFVY